MNASFIVRMCHILSFCVSFFLHTTYLCVYVYIVHNLRSSYHERNSCKACVIVSLQRIVLVLVWFLVISFLLVKYEFQFIHVIVVAVVPPA